MSDKEVAPMDQKSDSSHAAARRSFLRKSAIAAPVITSLASKPVWAVDQCTISGLLSGNLSTHDSTCNFGGLSPGYWKNHTWPFSSPNSGDKFQALFAPGILQAGDDGYGETLLNVLNTGGGVNHGEIVGLNRHMVATACNYAYALKLNTDFPGGIEAIFEVRDSQTGALYYSSWDSVKSAYAAALIQFRTETSHNGRAIYTLAEDLAIKLSKSYHQFDGGDAYGVI